MSTMIGSQSLVLATAMAVSTTVIFLAFSRQKPDSDSDSSSNSLRQPLRSCLSSPGSKRKRQNKRVTFADNVKEARRPSNEAGLRKTNNSNIDGRRSCRRDVIPNGMPANRVALYNGIIRNRSQRMVCSSH